MATLATFVNRFVGARSFDEIEHENSHPRVESCRLRPLPNEDVYLFVKRIDNRAVVRAIDPAARRARTGSMLTSFGLAVVFIAGLAPAAYNTMEGYHIQSLRKAQAELKKQINALDIQEADLLTPARLRKLAERMGLQDPAQTPGHLQYLEGKPNEARNREPGASIVDVNH
jgi:hypothetical protein